jgi:hypothetical protein
LRQLFILAFLGLVFDVAHPSIHAAAISPNVLIYQVQTGGAGSGTATQELIILKNVGSENVNISGWCVQYSSAADNVGFSACIEPSPQTELWLSAGGLVSLATNEFVSANPLFVPDVVFSSGLAATGGHLRLLNADSFEIDKVGWGSAVHPEALPAVSHSSGKVLGRNVASINLDTDNNSVDFSSVERLAAVMSGLYEVMIPIDSCPNIEGIQSLVPYGMLQDDDGDCFEDICPNLDELQKVMPVGYVLENELCILVPLEDRPLVITELYPNSPSYDTGNEFIELYNPHDETISLKGYSIQLGPDFSNDFVFASGEIGPKQYLVFSDTETGIVLPNSSGIAMRLKSPAGTTVSEVSIYPEIADNESWSLVDDQWIVTNQVTRARANLPYVIKAEEEVLGVTTVLAPCPAGKYRNPTTKRCRTIETVVSSLSPCDEDEYRNPETNRCRKVSSAVTTLKPCDEGEERNPETNRCRKISIVASSQDDLADIIDVPTRQTSGKINWLEMSILLGATSGYMVYEWRNELRRKLRLH